MVVMMMTVLNISMQEGKEKALIFPFPLQMWPLTELTLSKRGLCVDQGLRRATIDCHQLKTIPGRAGGKQKAQGIGLGRCHQPLQFR